MQYVFECPKCKDTRTVEAKMSELKKIKKATICSCGATMEHIECPSVTPKSSTWSNWDK